jgi:hypothetical protein
MLVGSSCKFDFHEYSNENSVWVSNVTCACYEIVFREVQLEKLPEARQEFHSREFKACLLISLSLRWIESAAMRIVLNTKWEQIFNILDSTLLLLLLVAAARRSRITILHDRISTLKHQTLENLFDFQSDSVCRLSWWNFRHFPVAQQVPTVRIVFTSGQTFARHPQLSWWVSSSTL